MKRIYGRNLGRAERFFARGIWRMGWVSRRVFPGAGPELHAIVGTDQFHEAWPIWYAAYKKAVVFP